MPLPAGIGQAEVILGDPTGRYLIGDDKKMWSTYMVWVDGEVEVLPDPPSASGAYPGDVNSSGEIAVTAGVDDGEQAFRYVDGEYTELPRPDDLKYAEALGKPRR